MGDYWECPGCRVVNPNDVADCDVCNHPRPEPTVQEQVNPEPEAKSTTPPTTPVKASSFKTSTPTFLAKNPTLASKSNASPSAASQSLPAQSTVGGGARDRVAAKQAEKGEGFEYWTCSTCGVVNPIGIEECDVCNTLCYLIHRDAPTAEPTVTNNNENAESNERPAIEEADSNDANATGDAQSPVEEGNENTDEPGDVEASQEGSESAADAIVTQPEPEPEHAADEGVEVPQPENDAVSEQQADSDPEETASGEEASANTIAENAKESSEEQPVEEPASESPDVENADGDAEIQQQPDEQPDEQPAQPDEIETNDDIPTEDPEAVEDESAHAFEPEYEPEEAEPVRDASLSDFILSSDVKHLGMDVKPGDVETCPSDDEGQSAENAQQQHQHEPDFDEHEAEGAEGSDESEGSEQGEGSEQPEASQGGDVDNAFWSRIPLPEDENGGVRFDTNPVLMTLPVHELPPNVQAGSLDFSDPNFDTCNDGNLENGEEPDEYDNDDTHFETYNKEGGDLGDENEMNDETIRQMLEADQRRLETQHDPSFDTMPREVVPRKGVDTLFWASIKEDGADDEPESEEEPEQEESSDGFDESETDGEDEESDEGTGEESEGEGSDEMSDGEHEPETHEAHESEEGDGDSGTGSPSSKRHELTEEAMDSFVSSYYGDNHGAEHPLKDGEVVDATFAVEGERADDQTPRETQAGSEVSESPREELDVHGLPIGLTASQKKVFSAAATRKKSVGAYANPFIREPTTDASATSQSQSDLTNNSTASQDANSQSGVESANLGDALTEHASEADGGASESSQSAVHAESTATKDTSPSKREKTSLVKSKAVSGSHIKSKSGHSGKSGTSKKHASSTANASSTAKEAGEGALAEGHRDGADTAQPGTSSGNGKRFGAHRKVSSKPGSKTATLRKATGTATGDKAKDAVTVPTAVLEKPRNNKWARIASPRVPLDASDGTTSEPVQGSSPSSQSLACAEPSGAGTGGHSSPALTSSGGDLLPHKKVSSTKNLLREGTRKPVTVTANMPILTDAEKVSLVTLQAFVRTHHAMTVAEARNKKNQKKKNSLLELLETEKNYHYRLDIICQHFVVPLKKEATKPGGSFITPELINALFSCIEEIRDISTSVKDELIQVLDKKPIDNSTSVGNILLQNIEKFSSTYQMYCNNYSNVHETVVKLKKENQRLREFIEKAERLHSKGEDLETSLIRIVQRIPQYNMILSDLVKATEKWHADCQPLQKAEAEMNRVGKLVNEFMKEKDNVKKVLELANRMNGFPGGLALSMRRYVCDYIVNALEQLTLTDSPSASQLIEKSGSNVNIVLRSPRAGLVPKGLSNVTSESLAAATPSKQHIFLFNDVLIVTHPKKGDKYEVISYVSLLNPLLREPQIQIAEDDQDELVFGLIWKNKQHLYRMARLPDKQALIKNLEEAILAEVALANAPKEEVVTSDVEEGRLLAEPLFAQFPNELKHTGEKHYYWAAPLEIYDKQVVKAFVKLVPHTILLSNQKVFFINTQLNKVVSEYHLIELTGIGSNDYSNIKLDFHGGASFSGLSTHADQIINNLLTFYYRVFPGLVPRAVVLGENGALTVDVQPEFDNRVAVPPIERDVRCGGFVATYLAVSNYYNLPPRNDILNDVVKRLNTLPIFELGRYPELTPDDIKVLMVTLNYIGPQFSSVKISGILNSKESFDYVNNFISKSRNTTKLIFTDIEISDRHFLGLVTALENKNLPLQALEFERVSIDDKNLKNLAVVLSKRKLSSFALSAIKASKGFTSLLMALAKNSGLNNVNLCDISLASEAMDGLKYLIANAHLLNELSLAGMKYTNYKLSTQILTHLVPLSETLVALNISRSRFNKESLPVMKEFIQNSVSFRQLNVSDTQIPAALFKEILQSIVSKKLSGFTLVAASNGFMAADAQDWKEIFAHMTQIHTLDLSDNDFCDNGVAHILDALQGNTSLRRLSLDYTLKELAMSAKEMKKLGNFRQIVAKSLAAFITVSRLTHFSLKVSKEKEKSSALGADLGHFFQALAENHYLESLDITGHRIGGPNGILKNALKALKESRVTELFWDDNGLTMQDLTDFLEINSVNCKLLSCPLPRQDIALLRMHAKETKTKDEEILQLAEKIDNCIQQANVDQKALRVKTWTQKGALPTRPGRGAPNPKSALSNMFDK